MTEMNPYYARSSAVGDVFDIAHWSPKHAVQMMLTGLVFGALCAAAAAYAWNPDWFFDAPPQALAELNEEIRQAHRQHANAFLGVVGGLGLISAVSWVAALGCLFELLGSNYYFRAGPGGLSLRIPHGLSLAKLGPAILELDLSWQEIETWSFVQHKQFGAMSPNAGNLGALVRLQTNDGRKYCFSIDCFREPARVIYNRVEEARETVAMQLEPAGASDGRTF